MTVPADTAQIAEALREEATRLSGRSIDRGCVDSGIAANLVDRAASALSSQSLIIENAALSSGASEIAGRSQLSLSEAREAPEILPGGQDCATALAEAREEIERLKGLVAGIRECPQEPWQDIATAPKDGAMVLLGYLDKSGKFAARSGYWMPDITHGRGKPIGAWVCTMDTVLLDQRATHWAPLGVASLSPAATPVSEAGGEDSNDWYSGVQLEEIARQEAERAQLLKQLDHCASKPMRNLETFPMICEQAARTIRALAKPASSPAGEDVVEDAERWRALMSSQRMHMMGSFGFDYIFDPPDSKKTADLVDVVPRSADHLHFGIEFWSEHSAFGDPQWPDTFPRKVLTTYVDEMRRRAALSQSSAGRVGE